MRLDGCSDAVLGAALRNLWTRGSGLDLAYATEIEPGGKSVLIPAASPAPWSHVTDERRDDLRAGYGQYLADRTARSRPPVPLAPPSGTDTACAFCGTGSISVPATQVARAASRETAASVEWRTAVLSRSVLGAPRSSRKGTEQVVLCRTCADAMDAAPGTGQTATETAILAYARQIRETEPERSHELRSLVGSYLIVSWKIAASSAPNPRPWSHLVAGEAVV